MNKPIGARNGIYGAAKTFHDDTKRKMINDQVVEAHDTH